VAVQSSSRGADRASIAGGLCKNRLENWRNLPAKMHWTNAKRLRAPAWRAAGLWHRDAPRRAVFPLAHRAAEDLTSAQQSLR
jgi:hypothetical protein